MFDEVTRGYSDPSGADFAELESLEFLSGYSMQRPRAATDIRPRLYFAAGRIVAIMTERRDRSIWILYMPSRGSASEV